ncbi:MAG TPA: transporter substrate-binding domain-containing protein [Oligoflexus sp.]|uniref:substrate-binding periplasmic protein n=1 Tax=Oligoflexus sp. TaxID=1971216 RepID=UPI002D2E1E6C|nr:transporter substrate-binding domain-containing protein [Oligoflexus sp.]HYX33896.1 transporter substrate-binding domain-containing protein [Oligoflexus sp.]
MKRFQTRLVHVIGGFLLVAANTFSTALRAEVPKVLQACGDADEWPPFTYFERSLGKKTNAVSGYNVDYLTALLAESGRTAVFTLLPWKRCLERAKHGEFDIVLDGSKTPIREKDFLFPESHYQLTPIILYRKDWVKPDLSRPEVRSSLNVCGQLGYAYDRKNTPFENVQIQTPARTFTSVVMMLKHGRCDLVLFNFEIVTGYAKTGGLNIFQDKSLVHALLDSPSMPLYLMVSRNSPFRTELVDLLNKGIVALNKSGAARKLYDQHIKLQKPQ